MSLGGAEHSICTGVHPLEAAPAPGDTSVGSHVEQNCVSKEWRRGDIVGQDEARVCTGGEEAAKPSQCLAPSLNSPALRSMCHPLDL